MNRTNFEHAIYALLMQSIIGLSTGNWWAGAAFGAAFFIGREHAQAEERYLDRHRISRSQAPIPIEFLAFLPESWNRDSVLDVVFPVLVVLAGMMLNCS